MDQNDKIAKDVQKYIPGFSKKTVLGICAICALAVVAYRAWNNTDEQLPAHDLQSDANMSDNKNKNTESENKNNQRHILNDRRDALFGNMFSQMESSE